MAKRRHAAKDEILLVPFLDILCSLIGVLILIIVVLCVSQTQQTEGRTPEDVQMSQDAKRMRQEIVERKAQDVILKEKLASLEALQKQIEEKEQRFIKLRKLINTSKDLQEENLKISQKMQKELDDLMLEIEGMKQQQAESKKEIATLMAELKKRDVPPDKKIPPVIVQPSGTGMPAGNRPVASLAALSAGMATSRSACTSSLTALTSSACTLTSAASFSTLTLITSASALSIAVSMASSHAAFNSSSSWYWRQAVDRAIPAASQAWLMTGMLRRASRKIGFQSSEAGVGMEVL